MTLLCSSFPSIRSLQLFIGFADCPSYWVQNRDFRLLLLLPLILKLSTLSIASAEVVIDKAKRVKTGLDERNDHIDGVSKEVYAERIKTMLLDKACS